MNLDFSDDQKQLRGAGAAAVGRQMPARRGARGAGGRQRPLRPRAVEGTWPRWAFSARPSRRSIGGARASATWSSASSPRSWAGRWRRCRLRPRSISRPSSWLRRQRSAEARCLPKLASGELIGTFAFAERAGAVTPRPARATVARGALTGVKIAGAGRRDRRLRRGRGARGAGGADRAVPGRPHRPGRAARAVEHASTRRAIRPASASTARRPSRSARQARAGDRRPRCWTAPPCWSPSSRSAAPTGRWRWRGTTRWSASPSAGRSARSRRSSTCWPTCTSRPPWRAPTATGPPGRSRPAPASCRRPRRRRGSVRRRRSSTAPRTTSRCMAAWASPGSSTATCTIAAPTCWRCRSAASPPGRTS